MDPFKKLRDEAIQQRDSLIRHARSQYKLAIKEIRTLQTRLAKRPHSQFSKLAYKRLGIEEPKSDYARMTSVQAAKLVLAEGRPLILRELVMTMMSRGHREYEKLHVVTNATRNAMQYHPELFRLNEVGEWELAPGAESHGSRGQRTFRPE